MIAHAAPRREGSLASAGIGCAGIGCAGSVGAGERCERGDQVGLGAALVDAGSMQRPIPVLEF